MLTLTTDHWMIKYYTFIQKTLWRNDQEHIDYKLGLGDKRSWTYNKTTRANFCEIARHVFLWPTLLAALVLGALFAVLVLPFILNGLTGFFNLWSVLLTLAFVFGTGFVGFRYVLVPIVSKAKTKAGEIEVFQVYKKALKDKVCPLMKVTEVKEPVTIDQIVENIKKIETYQNTIKK